MEITKGKIEVEWIRKHNAHNDTAYFIKGESGQYSHSLKECSGNARIIQDAFDTYQATNKLPSELAEANKELLEVLKIAITHVKEINTHEAISDLIKKHSNA